VQQLCPGRRKQPGANARPARKRTVVVAVAIPVFVIVLVIMVCVRTNGCIGFA